MHHLAHKMKRAKEISKSYMMQLLTGNAYLYQFPMSCLFLLCVTIKENFS